MKTSWLNWLVAGFMFGYALSTDSWLIAVLLGIINVGAGLWGMEIDEAISNNIIDYPIPIHKSKFIRAYEKIKKRYMKDEND